MRSTSFGSGAKKNIVACYMAEPYLYSTPLSVHQSGRAHPSISTPAELKKKDELRLLGGKES